MTVTLDIPGEIEAQFITAANARGVPLAEYVRDFVIEHYQEDSEDLLIARQRLADPQTGITSGNLREILGLDD